MKRPASMAIALLMGTLGFAACASAGSSPKQPGEVLRVYKTGQDKEWTYALRDKNYSDLNDFPNKDRIRKVVVKRQTTEEERKQMRKQFTTAFGEQVIIIFTQH